MPKTIIENLWTESLEFEVEEDYKLTVGALELFIYHSGYEWQFRHRYITGDETKDEKKISFATAKSINKDKIELMRFIQSTQSNQLKFKPRLANRSIVAKPHTPIFLPSKETVTIYISSPVWLAIYLNGANQPLVELASFKLPDTWFGPKPHLGELCYASRFSGRTNLNLLPMRETRIITPVTITNNGADNLKLEKISIPCDYLAVYMNEKKELWTPTISVLRETDQNKTQIKIDKSLHAALQNSTRIGEPRVSDQSGLISKTIDMLFS